MGNVVKIGTPAHAALSAMLILATLERNGVTMPHVHLCADGSGCFIIPNVPGNEKITTFDWAAILSMCGAEKVAMIGDAVAVKFKYQMRNFADLSLAMNLKLSTRPVQGEPPETEQ
jgi:hypothetical protein